jgi:hypothetical protein
MRSPPPLPSSRAVATLAAAALLASALAGCGAVHDVRDVGFGERCASMAERAFPQARLHTAGAPDVTVADRGAVVDLRLLRTDIPADAAELRDLAVRCRFLDGVLTDFHWTTGPLR